MTLHQIKLSMNTRNNKYSRNFSYLNLFWSYNSSFNFNSPNIQIIKKYVNHDLIDSKLMQIARLTSIPLKDQENKILFESCRKYYDGEYIANSKLSNEEDLTLDEMQLLDNMKNALNIVNYVPFRMVLFHGFEKNLKYDYKNWLIGGIYEFNFFLSKTLSWKVATYFASIFSGHYFYQQYLLCKYPQNTKHICLDVKDYSNDEYEFLSGYEKFKYIEKVYHLSLLPWPVLRIYYVMEYIN